MESHIVTVSNNPPPHAIMQQPLDVAQQDDAERVRQKLEEMLGQNDQADPAQLAEADANLRALDSLIQSLEAELAVVEAEDIGDISAQVSDLKAARSSLSAARKSGSKQALSGLLSSPMLKAIMNEAKEEEADGIDYALEDDIEREFIEDNDVANARDYFVTNNVENYTILSYAAQDHFAVSAAAVVAQAPELQSLMALHAMINANPVLISAMHRCDALCEESFSVMIDAVEHIAEQQPEKAGKIKGLAYTLKVLHDHEGLSHSWLPCLLRDFDLGNIGIDGLLERLTYETQNEVNELNKISQNAINALSAGDSNILQTYVSADLSGDDLRKYMHECKELGLLEPAIVNEALDHVKRLGKGASVTDKVISAVASLNYNTELQKSLLQLRITLSSLPQSDQKDFVNEIMNMQQETPQAFQQYMSAIIDGNNGLSQAEGAVAANLAHEFTESQLREFLNALMNEDVAKAKQIFGDALVDEGRGDPDRNLAREFTQELMNRSDRAMMAETPTTSIAEVLPDGTIITHEVEESYSR